ncbi:hypothetical protein TPSea814_000415 [Treponema pallidum subsp. pallidum str. Sea 81-4]|nr:hypothetical protein TPSea814_000415 [Treponema pallidum subsp. pallidum str. Sea 81-4]ANA42120.1 hypothetical protein A4W95_00284 [Treponema pallidum subsp. pallidum]
MSHENGVAVHGNVGVEGARKFLESRCVLKEAEGGEICWSVIVEKKVDDIRVKGEQHGGFLCAGMWGDFVGTGEERIAGRDRTEEAHVTGKEGKVFRRQGVEGGTLRVRLEKCRIVGWGMYGGPGVVRVFCARSGGAQRTECEKGAGGVSSDVAIHRVYLL